MSIAITDDHRALADTAADFLLKHGSRAAARSLLESPAEALPDLWKDLAQLGWLGIGVPEADGGSGGTALDLIVLCEELGRGSTDLVACLSLTTSGLRTLIASGTAEQRDELVPALMDGSRRLSISISEPDSGSE